MRLLCGLVRQLDRLAPLDGGVDRAPDELARAATEVLGAVVGTNRERVRVEPATAGATLALGEDVFDFAPHAISGWSWRPGETET